jgi:cell division protein ZapA (FtsZ GTPase activity inhibitor)
MNISEKQSRNLYAVFTVMFAINVVYTIWNFHESRKLRSIQQKIAEQQLKSLKNGNKESEEDI